MGPNMKETGKMTCRMEMEWKLGKMVQNTLVYIMLAKKMGSASITGMMDLRIKEYGKKTKFMDWYIYMFNVFRVSMNGRMEDVMKENGHKAIWKDTGSIHGKMVDSMKASIKMIKRKDLEFIFGQTRDFIRVIGKMENNMALENI
jgi:hypothetical protein